MARLVDPSDMTANRSILKTVLIWVGRKLGIMTTQPEIWISPWLQCVGLIDDPRAANRGQSYLIVRCMNEQRMGWLSRCFRTETAQQCRGEVSVVNDSGVGIKDSVVLCRDRMVPALNINLPVGDRRFHIPMLSVIKVGALMTHPVRPHVTLESGTYLMGARFFSGLHDHERLSPGRYTLHLEIGCVNADPISWDSVPFEIEVGLDEGAT
jgi:hypothetical protein